LRRSKQLLAFLAFVLCALSFGVASASAEPPQVTTPQVLAVSYTTVEVGGEIDAGGELTQYYFEVSPDGGVSWEPKGPYDIVEGSTLEPIPPATLEELAPGTTYQVRLAAIHLLTELEPTYSAPPNPEFTTTAVAAPGVTISAPDPVTGTTARFLGSIEPGTPAGDPAAYDVEWNFECTPACPGNLAGTIPADSTTTEVEVEATGEGLAAGTDYEVTLNATNKGGTNTDGPVLFSTPTIAPVISSITAHPSISEALLEASINPGGLATTYHFDYGATDAYGSTTPVASLPLGGEPVQASKTIEGLSPEATYHYRLIATNSLGTTTSGDRTFTTQPPVPGPGSCSNEALRTENSSNGLPDCRAYEKVSPSDKSDQGISFNYSGSSPSGSTISYAGYGAFGGSEATGLVSSQYVGARGDTGWSVRPLFLPKGSPAESGVSPLPYRISPDANEVAILGPSPSIPGAPMGVPNIYLRNGLTGAARLVTTAGPPPGTFYEPFFGAASDDFNHVAFTARAALTPGAPSGVENVYRWDEGELQLASILPSGLPVGEGAVVPNTNLSANRRAMSSDGSRLFFITGSGSQMSPIYLREGDATTEITASQKTGSFGEPGSAAFMTATPDGSKSYFISSEQLTNDSEAVQSNDLYRYDAETHELIDLTPVPGGAGVVGVGGEADTDGSYLYFFATSQLDGSHGTPGEHNLYLWHEGDPIRFIATLKPSDLNDESLISRISGHRPARFTTPDGRHLVFTSAEQLTEYPTNGFQQVYYYDADSARLSCISCNPSGVAAEGNSSLAAGDQLAPILAQSRRDINDDGTRAFFNSSNALVPTDSNGVQDVYEWEAEGTGSCRSAHQNGGCIYLISTGKSPAASFFADASADGGDVFFTTFARLTAGDEDGLTDLYDARVDGGYSSPAGRPQPCAGEACRGPGAPRASTPSIGSSAFYQLPPPSLRASGPHSLQGKAGSLKISVSEPGKLGWSGPGLVEGSRYLKNAGPTAIKFSLSRVGSRSLASKGIYRTQLRLSFTGGAGRSREKSFALTFRQPSPKSSSKSSAKGR
jgi:hypothetical protein